MTIPRRTDHMVDDSAFTRLKLLAELPHMGAAPEVVVAARMSSVESPARSTRTLKSSHPAFAELAERPTKDVLARQHHQTRFVDHAHVDHEWESVDDDRDEDLPRRCSKRVSNRDPRGYSHTRAPQQSTSWGALFSQTHEQIAPLAGVIVTAALFASAALMFWMMFTSRQGNAELNEFALPGEGFCVELSEPQLSPTNSLGTPPLAESSISPSSGVPGEFGSMPTAMPSGESPAELPTEISNTTLQPTIEPASEPALLGQLLFPVTNTPLELDYSKALHNPTEDLQALPAIAERTDTATTEPINR